MFNAIRSHRENVCSYQKDLTSIFTVNEDGVACGKCNRPCL